jgi:hypothetical protein
MNKYFEEDYQTRIALEKAYDEAETEESKDAIREKAQRLDEAINAKGKSYRRLFRAYLDMKERGNEHLDFGRDAIWERDIPEIVTSLKENNIKAFTLSARSTDAIETAAGFEKAGCQLIGLTEINGYFPSFFNNEYEKMPALLFSLK